MGKPLEGIKVVEVAMWAFVPAAGAILSEVEEELLYARVDLLRDRSDSPVLMELELVEPDLYLEHDPAGGAAFAEAIARAAAR